MKDILGMLFAEDNFPDIGSIKKADDGTLILKEQDIPKLNNVLTRAVCVGTYNVPVFGFNTGHVAFCPNASRAFMYESTDDEWYEFGVMNMTDKLIYLLLAQNANTTSDIETQTLPFTFKGNGRRLKNYQIYGNTGGVGDLDSNTNKYVIPVTINGTATNISLDSPLGLDDYIDFKEQKRYNSDNTSEIVLLPAITTVNGINILDVDTTVTPSKIGIQGDIDTSKLLYINVDGTEYAGRIKVTNGKPVFEYYT